MGSEKPPLIFDLPYGHETAKIPPLTNFGNLYMEKTCFTVQKRDGSVKANVLRKQALIPAEFYGHGLKNESYQMNYQDFRRLFKKNGYNTVIELDVEGGTKRNVLVHQVQFDPVTDRYIHVDFINVRMDEAVTTTVPIKLEGTAPAVREMGGVLVQSLDEIEITCLPGDLIHEVVLQVDSLVDFNASLHVSDIKLSDKITILSDPEQTICAVQAPAEEEVAPVEAVDVGAVEVTTEKKDAEGGSASEEKKEE